MFKNKIFEPVISGWGHEIPIPNLKNRYFCINTQRPTYVTICVIQKIDFTTVLRQQKICNSQKYKHLALLQI